MLYEWSGTFTSSHYGSFIWPIVSGKMTADLAPVLLDVKDAQVTLNYDGWYRSNQISHLRVSYSESLGDGSQIGFSTTGVTKQDIRFVIVTVKQNAQGHIIEMTGLYESINPIDRGNWSMTRSQSI